MTHYMMQLAALLPGAKLDVVEVSIGYRCDVAHDGELVAMRTADTPEDAVAASIEQATVWASRHGWMQ